MRSPATVNHYLVPLRQIFEQAHAMRDPVTRARVIEDIPKVPVLKKPRRLPRPPRTRNPPHRPRPTSRARFTQPRRGSAVFRTAMPTWSS